MRNENVMRNEDIGLENSGQLLALRFSAMFAQCQQGQGVYDEHTNDPNANDRAATRAIAVSDACHTLLEDTANLVCDQATGSRGLEPDELDMLYSEEMDPAWHEPGWEPVQAGVPKQDGYRELLDEITATDRSRNNAAFDILVDFASAARRHGLEGILPPIQGVDKYSVGTEVLTPKDFVDIADITDVDNADRDSLESLTLFGIEIRRDEAFSTLRDFTEAFEPDQRSQILDLVDSYGHTMGVDARVQSMLFQHETQPVEHVMEDAAEVLGVY